MRIDIRLETLKEKVKSEKPKQKQKNQSGEEIGFENVDHFERKPLRVDFEK